jgi:hypothetical protein
MVATPAKKPKFVVTNSDDPAKKPPELQKLWTILSKMDPEAELFVDNKALIGFEGKVPKGRTPKDLKFTEAETALLRPFGVVDGPDADNPETATGIVLSMYQLVEAAYVMGMQAEAVKQTVALAAAADEPVDDDDDDVVAAEVFDEEMEELAEDDPDEEDDDDDDDDSEDDDDDDDDDDDA